jgi:hypothetical protein
VAWLVRDGRYLMIWNKALAARDLDISEQAEHLLHLDRSTSTEPSVVFTRAIDSVAWAEMVRECRREKQHASTSRPAVQPITQPARSAARSRTSVFSSSVIAPGWPGPGQGVRSRRRRESARALTSWRS